MSEEWTRVWVPGPSFEGSRAWLSYSANFAWNNRAKYSWLHANIGQDNFRVYKKNQDPSNFGWWLEFRHKQDAIAYKLKWAGDETDNRPPA